MKKNIIALFIGVLLNVYSLNCWSQEKAATIIADVTQGCAPLTVNFSVENVVKEPTRYYWTFDGVYIGYYIQNDNHVSHTFLEPGYKRSHVEIWTYLFNGSYFEWTWDFTPLFIYINVLEPIDTNRLNPTICEGESYFGYNQTGVYYITETASNGCDSIVELDLIVNPADTTELSHSICEGESYLGYNQTGIYYITETATSGCDSIIELDLTVNPIDTTELSHSICEGESYLGYNQTGIYYTTETATSGCDSIVELDLIVNVLPQLFIGNDTTIYLIDTLVLSSNNEFSFYLWNTHETTQSIIVKGNELGIGEHHYWLQVTDNKECINSDTIIITIDESNFVNNLKKNSIKVYPNPSRDFINIEFDNQFDSSLLIEIYTINGIIVYRNNIDRDSLYEQIDISNLPKGIYLLSIKTKGKIEKIKIVKE